MTSTYTLLCLLSYTYMLEIIRTLFCVTLVPYRGVGDGRRKQKKPVLKRVKVVAE